MYKIRDDSIKPRQFLGTDSEDEIKAIFTEHQGHSLHEIIDGNDPLRPFIDFDLSQETLNKIEPKLTYWDIKTLTIANSSDQKKMSYHISTFGLQLKNITKVAVFTKLVHKKLPIGLQANGIVDNIANKSSFSLRMLGTPKIIKETNEHVHPKRAVIPKNGTIFDFMLRPSHNDAEIKDSPILETLKEKTSIENRSMPKKNKIDAGSIGSEVEYIEKLLEEYKIEGFGVLYPLPTLPNIFPLNRIAESQCPLSDQETQTGTKKPSLKLTLNALVLEQKNNKRTWILKHRKPDSKLYFGMAPTLDFSKITINIVELEGEPIKLISLIDRIYDSKAIMYDNIDFLPYSPNIEQPKNKFFNLFLGFKAKPALQINYDLVNPIIWHIENIWCARNKVLSIYVLKWLAFLVQYPAKIPGTLVYSTSDLGKILGKFNSSIQGQDYVSIERKGLENQDCGHFPRFIVLSNHDAPIRVEQGDGRIVCLDVSPRCKDQIEKPGCAMLYQEYRTWCETNGEKPFSNNNFGKKIPQVNIERKCASGGKREWQYILNRFKIIVKLRESVNIPVFDVPEIVTPELEKNITELSATNRIKKSKDSSPVPILPVTNETQALFDSIIEQPESSVVSSSKSTNISLPPEIEHVESVDNEVESSEIIEELVEDDPDLLMNDEPEISPDLPANDEPKSSNDSPSLQISYPPGYQTRKQ
ncbi:3454_t:CDS:2 [Cetraspora pellucida]|uniref:3454_t:CDS:1 n=1 Tax=Cetraspora pellucida TaxID=1433469 RepID=A0A9N9GI93_9GLOM|nr:3454_t:CDS:2 [Cetraspora pellucida]